jgi:hypothetical protein
LRYHRALDQKVHIAPVIRVLCMTGPLVGNPNAPCKPGHAIHHKHLSMGTVVESSEAVPLQRMIALISIPAALILLTSKADIFSLPSQSSITRTLTPALARSINASANC